jgi:hypothetical protein
MHDSCKQFRYFLPLLELAFNLTISKNKFAELWKQEAVACVSKKPVADYTGDDFPVNIISNLCETLILL